MDKKKLNAFFMELYSNPEMLENFVKSPKTVLNEKGFDTPEGKEIKVLIDTENVTHMVLPYLSQDETASIEELEDRVSKSLGITLVSS